MKKKVIVCGTNYGIAYLSVFLDEVEDFEIKGILANGSKRSVAFAKGFNIPLYKSIEDIPSDIDIACVAIKSSIMGGDGTRIAIELMRKGINVIQEHPLHPQDIKRCLRQAQESAVSYHINSHFVNTKPVKIFIDYINKALDTQQPLFIDAITSLNYSLIDILGRCLGKLTPYGFSKSIDWDLSLERINKCELVPFKCLQGVIGGVPITLKYQNFYDAESDIDENLLLLHRITIGMSGGIVTLTDTHGSVIWSTPHFKVLPRDPISFFSKDNMKQREKGFPSSVILYGETCPTDKQIAEECWREEILIALHEMADEIDNKAKAKWQSKEYLLSLSEIWMELSRMFGSPMFTKFCGFSEPYPNPLSYKKDLCK